MIRSTLTAHLAEADRTRQTLQLNDRDIGVLATQEQRHYVMSGNRRVQLIAGLQTDPGDHALVLSARALLRYWLVSFRELQINGLDRLPAIVERNRLTADFLLLMDSELVLVWCPSSFGVYLHRGRHLYRQQPTYPPQSGGLASFCRTLDFYAFRPREGDDLLIIDPSFIDLFDAADLEDLLADTQQINVAMTELTRLAYSYGRDADTSWFSAQIQRLDTDLELLSAKSRERASGRRETGENAISWIRQIQKSKVVPLLDGNVRIAPADLDRLAGYRPRQPVVDYGPKPPTFRTDWQADRQERFSLPVKGPGGGPAGHENRGRISRKPRENWLDRVKHWNTEGIRGAIVGFHRKLTHLVPGSRGLSLLAYLAIWLVALVLLLSAFHAIRGDGKAEDPREEGPKVTSQESRPAIVKTEFEIDIIVKASSLRVVSEPGGDELVASVTRGDHVTQLTSPLDGWILIRLSDGRSGYVPESLLLSPGER